MQPCKAIINRPGGYAGCGRCLPCRIRAKRVWTHRIMLEASLYAESVFVTLTFSDEHLPKDSCLSVKELRRFTDLFRYYHGVFRYFAVGEYGDENGRPHYHLVLFDVACTDDTRDEVAKAWKKGFIDVKPLTLERAAYVCGYVVKKMTSADDERLCGRTPEFRRSSLGIGKGAVDEIFRVISRYSIRADNGDVPFSLAHGGKLYPLGKYLRRRLRLRLAGISEDDLVSTRGKPLARLRQLEHAKAPDFVSLKVDDEMQELRAKARNDPFNPSEKFHIQASLTPKVKKIERRQKLFNSKKGKL